METDMAREKVAVSAPVCVCGKRHRRGTECEVALRREARLDATQDVLDLLRRLPAGTAVLLDRRGARARSRTLEGGEVLLRRHVSRCEWGTLSQGRDGEVRMLRDLGGYVPNSYRYTAETDELHVVAAEERLVVIVERVRASSRPYGSGSVVDRFPPLSLLRSALVDGAAYNAPWCQAAEAQSVEEAEMLRLLKRRESVPLTADEQVKLDSMLAQQP